MGAAERLTTPSTTRNQEDAMSSRLEGKTVIVTGVARGIGKAIAEMCSEEGASLILIDTDEKVKEVAAGPRTYALVGDVRDAELASQAVAEAVSALRRA